MINAGQNVKKMLLIIIIPQTQGTTVFTDGKIMEMVEGFVGDEGKRDLGCPVDLQSRIGQLLQAKMDPLIAEKIRNTNQELSTKTANFKIQGKRT